MGAAFYGQVRRAGDESEGHAMSLVALVVVRFSASQSNVFHVLRLSAGHQSRSHVNLGLGSWGCSVAGYELLERHACKSASSQPSGFGNT